MKPHLWRILPFAPLALGALALWAVPTVPAAEMRYLRIAAGPANSSAFAGATALAAVVTRPPGLPPCPTGDACGVPGVVALAQSLATSDAILDAVASGTMDTGLLPANAVYGARCPLPGAAPRKLAVLGAVYDEALHVVARRDADLATPEDMRGKRVAVGVAGSEDRRLADRLLTAYGLKRRDVRLVELGGDAALAALAEGRVDVVPRIAAWPDPRVLAVVERGDGMLLPVEGLPAERLRDIAPFDRTGAIPAEAYGGGAVATVMQPVLWVAGPRMPDAQAAALAGALARPANLAAMAKGELGLPFARAPLEAVRIAAPPHPGTQQLRASTAAVMECPAAARS